MYKSEIHSEFLKVAELIQNRVETRSSIFLKAFPVMTHHPLIFFYLLKRSISYNYQNLKASNWGCAQVISEILLIKNDS